MILFIEDWALYPSAIVDLKTPNRSFVDIAGVYKLMGVKNHAFVLALHNPNLVGIDPHDPNLTITEKRMVLKETHENPWYFFREVVKVPPQAGEGGDPFLANRGNIATIWAFFNHIMTLLIQPRQTGKSLTCDSIMAGILNVWARNTNINLMTKSDSLRRETVERIKDIIDYLPDYVKMRTPHDNNNGESISIELMKNIYKTTVAQSSEKAAFNSGRGMTSPIIHVDEFAYYSQIEIALQAALPATGAAMEAAARKNAPYGVLLTTTAGWLDSQAGAYAYKYYMDATIWHEQFFDCDNVEALKKVLRQNGGDDSESLVIDMNHRQLGKTDKWVKQKIQASKSTAGKAETDFLNIWADGSSASPFDKALLAKMKDTIREDFFVDIDKSSYVLRWYVDNPKHLQDIPMVMGLDTSDAVGSDDIAMVIRRVDNGVVVAVGEYNETNTITFAEWVLSLLMKYTKLVMIIERRSSGTSIADYVMKFLSSQRINPYSRVFNWIVDEKSVNGGRFSDMVKGGDSEVFQNKHRKEVGFATSNGGRAARNKLYGEALQSSMSYTHTKVFDKKLISQINKIKVKNGRLDHEVGEKDDLVIAWLLGYWFMSKAQNVEFYGMKGSDMLSKISTNSASNAKEIEDLESDESNRIIITELIESLKLSETQFKTDLILNRIEKIKDKLINQTDMHLNIDNAIRDVMLLTSRGARRRGRILFPSGQ